MSHPWILTCEVIYWHAPTQNNFGVKKKTISLPCWGEHLVDLALNQNTFQLTHLETEISTLN